jgi:hypothetical protein
MIIIQQLSCIHQLLYRLNGNVALYAHREIRVKIGRFLNSVLDDT